MVAMLAFSGLAILGMLVRLPPTLRFWSDPIILEFAFGAALGWLQSRGVTLSRTMRWALVVLGLGLLAVAGPNPARCLHASPSLGIARRNAGGGRSPAGRTHMGRKPVHAILRIPGRHLLRHLSHPPLRDPRHRGSRCENGTGSDPRDR